MDSPSQHLAHATPRATLDASAKARKRSRRPRQSTASVVASFDDEMPPSTPLNRAAARPSHVEAFSPFSYRSSQDSPRPAHLSSPSVILFSGPADRGFERVHDDSFPQDLRSLKSMARSKFKFAPTQPIEMSYINPDGIVCELDDEHDLRALAVHANLAPKLQVHVTSSAPSLQPTAFTNGNVAAEPYTVAQQIPSDGDTAASERQSAPIAASEVAPQPIFATMPPPTQVPVPAQANGHAKNKDAASPLKSQSKGSAKAVSNQPTPSSAKANGKTSWEDREDAASIVARLLPDSGSQTSTDDRNHQSEASQVNGSAAPQPSTPAAKKTSSKRKRTSDSPHTSTPAARPSESTAGPTSPSAASAPAAKKPRGRPKTSLASTTAATIDAVPTNVSAPADSVSEPAASSTTASNPNAASDATATAPQPAETVALPQKETSTETRKPGRPRKSSATTTNQPTEDGAASQEISADTPKRGRAKKLASIKEAASGQEAPLETPKRGRPKKAATAAADQSAAPAIAAQQDPTATQESSADSAIATDPAEVEPAEPALSTQPVEAPAASQPEESSLEQASAAKAAATPKPRGRSSKKAVTGSEATSVAPAVASEEASAPVTTAVSQQTPSDAFQTNPDLPVKKKRGRPSKADLAARAALLASAEGASAADAEETPASGARSQTQPVSTEVPAESAAAAPAAVATPVKKVGRQPKSAKAAKAATARAEPINEVEATTAAPAAEPPAASLADQPGPVEVPAQGETDKGAANSTKAAQPDEGAAGSTDVAPVAAPAEAATSSSAPSQVDATPPESTAAANAASSKRAITAAKPRASKANGTTAAAAASESVEACVVCGASPSHDREACPIWKGGSEAILELLAMLRKKSYKNKKDKETVRMLQDWLSLQFNAPALDFTVSQDSIQPSQDTSLTPAADQPVTDADAAVNESVDPIVFTQESAVESAPASSPTAGKKASSGKATAAKKSILARATPEPQLPPPSGVTGPPAQAELSETASTAKPTPKAPRAQSKKAAAATEVKATKKATASSMSEPDIALTPSSPLQPSQSQSSQPPGTGLRAPSESSEAELATSPLLSAVPRASDDMDVDELPSNTPSQPSTATQQLEERKRRMKLADAAVTSSPRSRSASITSSDTSHGGQSSDDESDADSDAGAAPAAKGGRKVSGKQVKTTSTKAPSSPVAKMARTASAAKDASSGTDTSSSDSETESEPDTAKKSTSRARPSGDNANVKTPASKTAKRLPAPENPFLRGLTPLSSRQSNGANSQKSTPFTRLSELKPASLRQNLSQPGSPLSTGGSTPLSASGQTPFFASQPVINGDGSGSTDSSAAAGAFTSAAATPEPAQAESGSDDDDDESDSSSPSSSEDEAPKRGKASAKGGASTAAKRAGKGVGAKTARPAAAKKRKSVFDVFGKSG